MIPAALVDSLPDKLWWLGNVYRVFDRDLHFCTGGSRTIELDGLEIGRGSRPFVDFGEVPDDWSMTADEMAAVVDLVGRLQKGLGLPAGAPLPDLHSLSGDAPPLRVATSRDIRER